MKRTDVRRQPCSIARSLAVVGDIWSLMILRDVFYGVTRFDGFLERSGASRAIISSRLKTLVEEDVLERVPYQKNPIRYDYRLTPKGRDLQHVLLALMGWGDKWLHKGRGAPLQIIHSSCGHVSQPAAACSHCGGLLSEDTVRFRSRQKRSRAA